MNYEMKRTDSVVSFVDAKRACALSGISPYMLDYLTREGFVSPSGRPSGKRGKRRLFTFGDVIFLRVIGQMLESGLEVRRLKHGLAKCYQRIRSQKTKQFEFKYLATDGTDLFFRANDGRLESLTKNGQLAFAFLIDLGHCVRHVDAGWPSAKTVEPGRVA